MFRIVLKTISLFHTDIFGRLIDDIGDLPEELIQNNLPNTGTPSLLNNTDTTNSLSSDLSSTSHVTQNVQQQSNVPNVNTQSSLPNATGQAQPQSAAPNVNVNAIAQQQNPSVQQNLVSTQNSSQNQVGMSGSSMIGGPQSSTSSSPNTTINMYANSPHVGGVNSPRFTGLSSTMNAPSPQPTSISTSGDPTPSLPSVSLSPANSMSASSQSYPHTWGSRSNASYQVSVPGSAPMMYSTANSNPMNSPSIAQPVNALHGGMVGSAHMNHPHQQQAQIHGMGMSQPVAGMGQGMQHGMRISQPTMMHGQMQHTGMSPMQMGAGHPRAMVSHHQMQQMHPRMQPQPMGHHMAHGQMGMASQYHAMRSPYSTNVHHINMGMSGQPMRHPHPSMIAQQVRGPMVQGIPMGGRPPSYMSQAAASAGMAQNVNALSSLDHGPASNRTPSMATDLNLASSSSLSIQNPQIPNQGHQQPGLQMHSMSHPAQPQQPQQQQQLNQVINQGASSSQPLPMHSQSQPQLQVSGQNDLGGFNPTQQQMPGVVYVCPLLLEWEKSCVIMLSVFALLMCLISVCVCVLVHVLIASVLVF